MKRKTLNDEEVMYIVLAVPIDAVNLKMKCKLSDGRKTRARFKLEDILEARMRYSELDPDDHAFDTYVLTDLGGEQIEDDRGVY